MKPSVGKEEERNKENIASAKAQTARTDTRRWRRFTKGESNEVEYHCCLTDRLPDWVSLTRSIVHAPPRAIKSSLLTRNARIIGRRLVICIQVLTN